MGSKSDRGLRDKRSVCEGIGNGLEKSICFLVAQGHIDAWNYGWGFFEAALKYTQETEKNKMEFQMKLHGVKVKA